MLMAMASHKNQVKILQTGISDCIIRIQLQNVNKADIGWKMQDRMWKIEDKG